jgi:hypothetical protein
MDPRLSRSGWHSVLWDLLLIALFITCVVLGSNNFFWLLLALAPALLLCFRAWRRR